EKMLSNVSSDDFLEGRKSFLSLVKSTIQPNKEFYSKVLFLNQNVSFIDRINKTIEAKLKEEFKKHTDIDDEQIDVIFAYAVGGRIAVYRKWILGGFAISENAISSVLEKMSSSGLESFIY
ncbi:MAG: TetR family transcriptional regulator C-terminal domain-containing protein, partial [Clostridia bacterium]|nr:TetR family transcriptional regulator C-terminal domain-containing protein [Clostridia bacterium]